ncbi:hypothetical protein, partial [Streptomyces sp. NPDC003077]|uniref:hypothetical protein n=1 Tax=Streptomyces sp. NPDC003077 TaxID=3154443 RepID=UPI0033A8CB93
AGSRSGLPFGRLSRGFHFTRSVSRFRFPFPAPVERGNHPAFAFRSFPSSKPDRIPNPKSADMRTSFRKA